MLARQNKYYTDNEWKSGPIFKVLPNFSYKTQLLKSMVREVPPANATSIRCPHCGGNHIGNFAFQLKRDLCVEDPTSKQTIYNPELVIICPNTAHSSCSMDPLWIRKYCILGVPGYQPEQYDLQGKGIIDAGVLSFP